MMGRTHVLGGLSSLWLLALVPDGIGLSDGWNNGGVLAMLAALGALLPDLDARESQLKRLTVGGGIAPFALPAVALHRALGHRNLLHSAAGLGITAALVAVPIGLAAHAWQPAVALLLGYASHLLLDACTKSGIPFLFPNRIRRFALPLRLRLTTGSAAEEAVLALLGLLTITLLLRFLVGIRPDTDGSFMSK